MVKSNPSNICIQVTGLATALNNFYKVIQYLNIFNFFSLEAMNHQHFTKQIYTGFIELSDGTQGDFQDLFVSNRFRIDDIVVYVRHSSCPDLIYLTYYLIKSSFQSLSIVGHPMNALRKFVCPAFKKVSLFLSELTKFITLIRLDFQRKII